MADAMVSSGMAKAGYTYIVIDEGWTSGRDANGKIVPNGKMSCLGKHMEECPG